MENLISELNLTNESLLAVPIKDDEIFELLERLAATEEMFKAPVSTIRDVAELTEASPTLIARVLGEMRGPGELEQMVGRLDEHDRRLLQVEQKVSRLGKQTTETPTDRAHINIPNIVDCTVHEGLTQIPKVQEAPPAAWTANKQLRAYERGVEYRNRSEEMKRYLAKTIALWLLVIVAIWEVYSTIAVFATH